MTSVLAVALVAVGAVLQALFVRADRAGAYGRAAVLKGCAALAFVLVGGLGLWGDLAHAGRDAARVAPAAAMCLGLALGAVGDVLHALRFVLPSRKRLLFNVGAVTFLLGHLSYLAAVVPACGNRAWGVVASLALAAAVDVAVLPRIRVQSVVELVAGGAYLAVTSAVVGFAVVGAVAGAHGGAVGAAAWPGTAASWLALAVGTAAFLASDVMLAVNTFGGLDSPRLRATSLGTYYAGQSLIALSLVLAA
ncbi:lysoplasmalogenase family protein [Parafannyhessea umbonata]|uniref:lysoplasmalogenase family protein n=1 Tax=Parafannyhessea umbonata TaxID=604330 RepID=UPI0026EE6AB0|nr:lysoplasmalogenase family protein [Parafannyhessea umbonata]MCI7219638.1 lysoplasmalogenase [Parafannyhessea umbonata]